MNNNFSPSEQIIYDLVDGADGDDVPIAEIFFAVYGEHVIDNRDAQMAIGRFVTRVNRKLARTGRVGRIVPGKVKQTYCLVTSYTN